MINATKDELVFIQTGEALSQSVIAALKQSRDWMLTAYGHEELDLNKVNSKSYVEVVFPAYVERFILQTSGALFDEDYVRDAFELASTEWGHAPPDQFFRLTRSDARGKWGYRKSNLRALRRGFASFLVALHIRRAVILPYSFRWPMGLEKNANRKVIRRRELCHPAELPELLRFFRALESQSETQTETVFSGYGLKQRERLASVGQRLIVAAGWLTPEDANYEDLLALHAANEKSQLSGTPKLGCLMLADLLERKYKSICPITAAGWRDHLQYSKASWRNNPNVSEASVLRNSLESLEVAGSFGQIPIDNTERDAAALEQALAACSFQLKPDYMEQMRRLPGLDFNLTARSKAWLVVEKAYLKKIKRESNKPRLTAIGFLNCYLFVYLPYWFAAHPTSSVEFPDTPNKLIGALFVSDLGLLDRREYPVTLVEFIAALARIREWGNVTHYAMLKQLEKLFDFIARIGDQMPECQGFAQPLSEHDYPPVARSYGTNKRPIPRRIFKLYISYIESLAAHAEVLLNRILSGEVTDDQTGFLIKSNSTTIDCFELADLFGFIPVVFHQGKTIPLRRISNVLCMERKRLKDGRVLRIPHPHALHQILVSLYTGLRQNHIQWLDSATFDSRVNNEEPKHDYSQLYVNTDKAKTEAWQSHVNFRVIEILRAQLAWRRLIGEPGFSNKVFYNDNPDTKWGQYFPLFSYSTSGKPHHDNLYGAVWLSLLSGVQSILSEAGEPELWFVRLLPSQVPFADPDQAQKLYDYGSQQKRKCRVILKSDITPHSARVSVVSHAISILPADLIGRYWTGQTEATVYHYVVPDADEINAEQQRQNLAIRQRGYEQGYEAMLAASPGRKGPFIKADDVNSRLARSLKTDLEETIAGYGCVSLSLNGDTKTGIDVLRETRALGAVFNKTEICPYGNQCPPEVVVALKGFRRCGPCHFAVRSIEHVQAIAAKIRQVLEGLEEVEARLDAADAENLTTDEWDALAKSRDVLAEDFGAWQVSAEVLEVMRQRVEAGVSTKRWHIQRPEIIEQHLKRAIFPTEATDYLLARLHESEAFPALESPQIRAKFDLLRRNLLANTGNIREALRMEQPTNPAAECRALIRSIAAAHKLGIEDIRRMMDGTEVGAIPARTLRLLPAEVS